MSDSEIRKFRKKLRQIENLERLERDLNDEELLKISKKGAFRESLLQLLVSRCENSIDSGGFGEDYKQTLDNNFLATLETVETDKSCQSRCSSKKSEFDGRTCISASQGQGHQILNESQIALTEQTTPDSLDVLQIPIDGIEVSGSTKEKVERPDCVSGHSVEKAQMAFAKESTQKGKKAEHKKEKLKTLYRSWWDSHFHISTLKGHNDLVTCVDVCGSILVTGSRDTTAKIWDLESLCQTNNLGGHTGTVTGVCVISPEESLKYAEDVGLEENDSLVISCSLDCTIKLWSVNTGYELRSTYTYNPVTCLVYCPYNQFVVTGSDGGKIEIWKVGSSENTKSIIAYSESVSSLRVCDRRIYCASSDGVIKVLEVRGDELACLFVSESLRTASGTLLTQRCIRSMAVSKDVIYFGDDGINIKALVWKKGLVHKLSNHQEEFGVTDALCCHGNLLVSSAYNLDNGLSYLNVRCLPREDYMVTLNDEDTGRMVCIACVKHLDDQVTIITAGQQLKIWNMVTGNSSMGMGGDEVITVGQCFARLGRVAQDSDDESEIETTESEDESAEEQNHKRPGSQLQTSSGLMSWCDIV